MIGSKPVREKRRKGHVNYPGWGKEILKGTDSEEKEYDIWLASLQITIPRESVFCLMGLA